MNENEFQFRTAALGGFHKQDVLSYLERSAKEHREKTAELERELAGVKADKARLEEEKGEMERRQVLLEEENQRLAADLADREAALADATAGKETAERQEAALQEEAEKLRPAAKAYEAVKDRTASIELEAHGRAQAIEEEGRQKAKKHQQELVDWSAQLQAAYHRLRSDMDATLVHAIRELERAGQSLEGLSGELVVQDEALKIIKEQIDQMDPKPPQPLPIEEDN
ncbi:MAG: hypothetical protein HFF04_08450 [Oscillospiraceae bacterium]|nr:hypothetical protein [Oscillospiraceae bacterium]